ncbi:ABC transporter substrate-binding protein [Aquisalibacillus elongatus]|uniref:NitT/TauT family transport system substrate-binding protein n=1 Tax=Aquisalibacillus elongatus TaxID=485577 RepID=A0A3N5BTU7_9BACI|nr:ABC transporter substrate-binding protein [Aquisalibacillus elongatus]RPF53208.1 NitT/TauT family transport system substrate-binding protein [Aquisalibacillus elongatus]
MTKKWLILPLLMFVFALGACNQDEGPESSGNETEEGLEPLEERTTVVVAEDGAASGAGFYIANEMGYFEDYNIEIEFATFGNSDEMLPAIASGEVDVAGGISTASFFNSIAQGIDVRMIADKGHNVEGSSYFTFVIREDLQDEITSYEDFKGRKIAVSSRNAVDDYIFGEMLKHAGLTRDDVEFVLMSDFGNMLAAMGNEQIDAALQIEPLITQGESQGLHVRFGDATDYAPEAQIAMVLGSPKFLGEKREVAKRFMAAYLKGVRDYNDAFIKETGDIDRVIEIMTEYTALKDPEVWKNVGVTGLDPNGQMFVEDIKNQYEVYNDNDAISGELDFDQAIDTSLVEEVLELIGEYE